MIYLLSIETTLSTISRVVAWCYNRVESPTILGVSEGEEEVLLLPLLLTVDEHYGIGIDRNNCSTRPSVSILGLRCVFGDVLKCVSSDPSSWHPQQVDVARMMSLPCCLLL